MKLEIARTPPDADDPWQAQITDWSDPDVLVVDFDAGDCEAHWELQRSGDDPQYYPESVVVDLGEKLAASEGKVVNMVKAARQIAPFMENVANG